MTQRNEPAQSDRRIHRVPTVLSLWILLLAAAAFLLVRLGQNTPTPEPASPAVAIKPGVNAPLPDQNYALNPAGALNRMKRLVHETRGDFSRLSASDQRMFNSVSSGHGASLFRAWARDDERNLIHARKNQVKDQKSSSG